MALIDDQDRHEIYLAKLTTGLLNAKVYPSLEEAYKAARLILLDAESITSITVLRRIESSIAKEVSAIYSKGWQEATEELAEMAVYEAGWAAQVTGQYLGASLTTPAKKVIESYINKSLMTLQSGSRVQSGTWAQYVQGSVDAAVSQYNGIVAQGYQQGRTIGQITRDIRQSSNGILKQQAEALARTGQSHYTNQAREAMALDNSDVIKYRMFSATFDNRTTLQCFPAETKILSMGGIKNIFRSKYAGETVTIRTASGKKLTGTPNHPILTSAGFLPIGEIDPCKHVVYSPLINDVTVSGYDDVGMETTIGELFDSLNKPSVSRVISKSSTADDFYGDGFRGDGKVDIVSPYRKLRYDIKTVFDKNFTNDFLRLIPDWLPLKGFCFFLKHLFCWRPVSKPSKIASSSFKVRVKEAFRPSCFGEYFRWAKSCLKHFDSFFPVSNNKRVSDSAWERFHDPVSLKKGCNSGGGHVILLSDCASGKPIPVLIDNIVSVEREFADCHVYTLESDNGSYMAGGIIVKNCRGFSGRIWAITDDSYPKLPLHFNERSVYVYGASKEDFKRGNQVAVGGVDTNDARIRYNEKQDRLSDRREIAAEDRAAGLEATTPSKVKYRGKKDKDIFKPGPIPANTTQDAWLRQQPEWFQDSALGKTRAQLFRDGGIKIDKFTDMTGKPLTLDQLRELDADAFKRAGL